ncbi:2-dehydropantoate 2-reductase [Aliiglaciecola litoralis]|uniref:2-dehydropantoate 2-reductase n=1 Tax=Aliiglaciecola litoralis TaxID=582857 RepID=A0ABP3WW25_9ALTE
MQHHVIFGAGLIGCYLGAALRNQGCEVDLICRERVQLKLRSGIEITDYLHHKAQISGFTCNAHKKQPQPADVLWLTVKCTDVVEAIPQIKAFCDAHTVIICCQNGLGSDKPLKQALPDNLVLRAMVPFNVVEVADGHFHRGSQGALTLETELTAAEWLDKLVAKIDSDLLPVETSNDMSALLWAKLQLNLGNSVNALADIPVKAMLQQRGYRMVIAALMDELLLVTDKKHIQLPKVTALPSHWIPKVLRLPNWLFKLVANKMLAIDPLVRTSMWWDLSRRKKTEIHYLNGVIVDHAKALGIPCNANQKVIEMIENRENNQMPANKSAISASQLYKEVIHH